MNYLIDNHVLLWYIVGDKRIDRDVRKIIESGKHNLFISNASLWEISIKVSIGKLKLTGSLVNLKEFLNDKGFSVLQYDFDDLETLLILPFYHQDPFDRLIVAQALTKNMEIISDDPNVKKYLT